MAIIPDWTLFLQMANFIVLIIVLNIVCYKPIRNILIERKKKVRGFEESIQALNDDAADSEKTFQAKVGEAKAKGMEEKGALVQAAQDEEKRVLDELNRKAQAELEAVRAQIAKDAESARAGLKGQIEGFSTAIAQKILGRAVS